MTKNKQQKNALLTILCVLALAAFDGSLDAAKALHEAMLPGWMWNVECGADAIVWEGEDPSVQNYGIGDCPARAWLLAILRAKRAMGE